MTSTCQTPCSPPSPFSLASFPHQRFTHFSTLGACTSTSDTHHRILFSGVYAWLLYERLRNNSYGLWLPGALLRSVEVAKSRDVEVSGFTFDAISSFIRPSRYLIDALSRSASQWSTVSGNCQGGRDPPGLPSLWSALLSNISPRRGNMDSYCQYPRDRRIQHFYTTSCFWVLQLLGSGKVTFSTKTIEQSSLPPDGNFSLIQTHLPKLPLLQTRPL